MGRVHVHIKISFRYQKKKSKRKAVVENHDNEVIAVANAKRVQNLLTRRQHVTVSDEDNLVRTQIIEVQEDGEESGSEETSDLAQKKRFMQNLPTSPQSSDGDFSSPQQHQSHLLCIKLQVAASTGLSISRLLSLREATSAHLSIQLETSTRISISSILSL